MSILVGMFETLLNSYYSVCSSEGFFLAFAASQNRKSNKARFFQVEQQPKNFSIACAEQQSFIILNSCNFVANGRKSLKFYRFEAVQILVSLISLNCFLFLIYFAAEAGIVFNLFLNFEQK